MRDLKELIKRLIEYLKNKIKSIKSKEKNKKKKQHTKLDIIEDILNYGIIIGSVTVIIFIIFNTFRILNGEVSISGKTEYEIQKEYESLSKAHSDSEGVYLSIELNDITTSKEDYEIIKEKCNTYIQEDTTDDTDKIQTNLSIDTDEIYVDNINGSDSTDKDNKGQSKKSYDLSEIYSIKEESVSDIDNSKLTYTNETGPIYFQDKMILRFINKQGLFKIIASDKENVHNKSDIDKIFKEYEKSDKKSKTDVLYEEQYLQEIVDIFTGLFENGTDNLNKSTKKKAVRYLTYDGYKYIIVNNIYNITKSKNVKVLIAEIGKSDTEKNQKDRIFLRIQTNKETKDIILKLDNNYKIFDIDII